MFFVIRHSDNQVGDTLYLVDVLDPEPRAVRLDVAPCDSSGCGVLGAIEVQPLR